MSRSDIAVFLDRDGTIIEDRGDLSRVEDVVFFSDTFESLRRLNAKFRLFLITNQSGVSKGTITMHDVQRVNKHVVNVLQDEGIAVDDVFVCPHDKSDECKCRKPSPYYLEVAAERYGIDLKRSYVLGDHPHDVETAIAAGGCGVYLLTGHGIRHIAELGDGDRIVAACLSDAADMILDETGRAGELTNTEQAAHLLRRGGIVAFPTETVYGLAANALDPCAVAKVFAAKQRPHFDPLIVHLPDIAWLDRLARDIPDTAVRLVDTCWPGPLTIVVPRSELIPDIVTSGLDTVALRMPDHPLAKELLDKCGVPLAAPSANRFGCISPTCAQHVQDSLGNDIDMILDGGKCRVGIESTIVAFEDSGLPVILRPGGISPEMLEEACGCRPRMIPHLLSKDDYPQAPGMLERHYSPATPLLLIENGADVPAPPPDGRRCALLLADKQKTTVPHGFSAVEILSPDGNLTESAQRLFALLRKLDADNYDLLYAELVPDNGLGVAINDRLKRAAGQKIAF